MGVLFDNFDRVRVISLPSRRDRRRVMSRMLGDLDVQYDYFDACRPDSAGPFSSIGAHGAFLSHLEILKDARASHGSVLVLEDDCDFLPEIRSFNMPPCDIFYGGFEASNPAEPHSSDIIGAHCMGFSALAAKLAADYLESLIQPPFVSDAKAASEPGFDPAIRPPVDGAYVWFRRANPDLATVFHKVSEQRSSRSDITPGRLDRVPGISSLIELLRTIRHSRKRG